MAKVPCGPSLQEECRTLVALQHVQGVPTLVNSTCVCGSILTADIFDPVTSSLIAHSNFQRTFPSLVQTLQVWYSSGSVTFCALPSELVTACALLLHSCLHTKCCMQLALLTSMQLQACHRICKVAPPSFCILLLSGQIMTFPAKQEESSFRRSWSAQ